MKIIQKVEELRALQKKCADLQSEIQKAMPKELAALPGVYGFITVDEFCSAVQKASRAVKGIVKQARPLKDDKASRKGTGKKGGRRKISLEVRKQVIASLKKGKSATVVAKEFGISVPSVYNIKRLKKQPSRQRVKRTNVKANEAPTPADAQSSAPIQQEPVPVDQQPPAAPAM